MDMDVTAVFLAGSILTMIGFIIIVGGVTIINNILYKYWKPITLFKMTEFPNIQQPEAVEQVVEEKKK